MHDRGLLEAMATLPAEEFSGQVFRATRKGLDPLAPSSYGGRWSAPKGQAVLYTSFEWAGALKELSYHWAQQIPIPNKPILVHTLRVHTGRTLRLRRTTLETLGLGDAAFRGDDVSRMQEIGEAAGFLEFDGLIVPSVRYDCDNLIIFSANSGPGAGLFEVISSDEINDWGKLPDE